MGEVVYRQLKPNETINDLTRFTGQSWQIKKVKNGLFKFQLKDIQSTLQLICEDHYLDEETCLYDWVGQTVEAVQKELLKKDPANKDYIPEFFTRADPPTPPEPGTPIFYFFQQQSIEFKKPQIWEGKFNKLQEGYLGLGAEMTRNNDGGTQYIGENTWATTEPECRALMRKMILETKIDPIKAELKMWSELHDNLT